MALSFFPEPSFGWVFLVFLLAILVVAAYLDTRTLWIPKWISLVTLGLGLFLNIVRGGWLAGEGNQVYVLGTSGVFVGCLDGLLFSLAGFFFGFILFFLFWLLGVCGGGDVKLFAAVGTWIGPYLLFWVLLVTIVLVAVFVFLRLVWLLVSGQGKKFRQQLRKSPVKKSNGKPQLQPKHRVLGFSLPLALACLLVLPWAFRFELKLSTPPERDGTSLELNQPR